MSCSTPHIGIVYKCVIVSILVLNLSNSFAFCIHGNYCGPNCNGNGSTQTPTDSLDSACKRHDECLDSAGLNEAEQDICDENLRIESCNLPGIAAAIICATFSTPLPDWWHDSCPATGMNEVGGSGAGPDFNGGSYQNRWDNIDSVYIPIRYGHIMPETIDSSTTMINQGTSAAMFYLQWGGSTLDLILHTPNGTIINEESTPQVNHITNSTTEYYIIQKPEAGIWTIEIIPLEIPKLGENYSLIIYPIKAINALLNGHVAGREINIDNDEKFELIVLDIGINVINQGNYTLIGNLHGANGLYLDASIDQATLEPGFHIMHLYYNGDILYAHRTNSPYRLQDLMLLLGSSDSNLTICDIALGAYTIYEYNYSNFE